MAVNRQHLGQPTQTPTPSVAAGSADQLPRVEAEMSQHVASTSQVSKCPFQVVIK